MQVIVLAAGMGLRLGHLTRATPKALIPLNGLPLMDYTLTYYDCAYVGLTYIPGSSLDKYREAFHGIAKEIGDKAVVENVLPQLAKIDSEIQITPFDKHAWHEVDTREDLKKAEAALSQTMARTGPVMGYEQK